MVAQSQMIKMHASISIKLIDYVYEVPIKLIKLWTM